MKQREIKFRAWDGNRMIFLSQLMIGIGKGYLPNKDKAVRDSEPYAYFSEDTFNGEVRLGKHEVMQFTGLKDKNGVDIYEGDIMKHLESESTTIKKVVYDAQYGAFIMICDKYFQDLRATYGDENMYADTYLIIGNIYQNPELLK